MPEPTRPIALVAAYVAPRNRPSVYPEPLAPRRRGRTKRVPGDLFGPGNVGVNLTRLEWGAVPALRTDKGLTRLARAQASGPGGR